MGVERETDPSLEEAFGLVANDTRFAIIRALWEAEDSVLQFSTLRERAGVRDSGQFNYHLDQLIPRFVRRTDDGYELAYAGRRIIGAAVSGRYTDAASTELDPVAVGACLDPTCDGTIEAQYERGTMIIECRRCDTTVTDGLDAPPVLAAYHEPEELPEVFNRYLLSWAQLTFRGFCRLCGGPVETSLAQSVGDHEPVNSELLDVVSECRACGASAHSIVGMLLLDYPPVISFLHDAGVDLRETPVWEMDWLLEATGEIVSEDPVRLEVTIAPGEEALRVTMDEDFDLLEYHRE